jgi:hypothetical protein
LQLPDFCRGVDLLAKESFSGIVNISGGETTLHPSLPEMLRYASQRLSSSRIAVFTHGHWVGQGEWRVLLQQLLAGPNVLVRFSLDRQHAEGIACTLSGASSESEIQRIESERLEKARLFLEACREFGAEPGRNFDFAFKGTAEEGAAYTANLGVVPLYLITFRPDPTQRPKTAGFFALDVDDDNRPLVYQTLGHIPDGESLGGIETLSQALAWNRSEIDLAFTSEQTRKDMTK